MKAMFSLEVANQLQI